MVELMIKSSLGKLQVNFDPVEIAEQSGFELLDFSAQDAMQLKHMPFHHKDPFDRMLIAQSNARGFALMTDDQNILHSACNTTCRIQVKCFFGFICRPVNAESFSIHFPEPKGRLSFPTSLAFRLVTCHHDCQPACALPADRLRSLPVLRFPLRNFASFAVQSFF